MIATAIERQRLDSPHIIPLVFSIPPLFFPPILSLWLIIQGYTNAKPTISPLGLAPSDSINFLFCRSPSPPRRSGIFFSISKKSFIAATDQKKISRSTKSSTSADSRRFFFSLFSSSFHLPHPFSSFAQAYFQVRAHLPFFPPNPITIIS